MSSAGSDSPFVALARRLLGSGSARAVLKGSISALGIKLGGMVCGFALSLLLTRALGAEGFGAYALALSWALLFSAPVQSGLVGVMVREVAASKAVEAWAPMKGLLVFGNLFCLMLSLLSALVFFLFWAYGSSGQSTLSASQVAWVVLLVPIYCLASLRSAVLRGLGLVTQGLSPEQVVRPIFQIILITLLIFAFGTGLDATSALIAHVFAASVAFGVGAILLYRSLPREIQRVPPSFHVSNWLKPVMAFALVSGFGSIAQSFVSIILGQAGGNAEVGLLRSSQQLASLSGLVILAVNSAAAPHVASLFRLRKFDELELMLRRFSWIMILGTLPPSVILGVWGHQILEALFGPEFGPGSSALTVLAIGQLLVSTSGLVGLTMNMAGFEKDTLVCCVVALLITAAASIPMAEANGATGAALATVLGQVVMQALLLWRVKVRIGISTSVLFHGRRPA